tara:strand:- start:408 stop:1019 length:612 start_codon:yes stop_codon:yes gene_type:complete
MRERHLAIFLSKLNPQPCKHVELEQYSTDGNIASKFISSIISYGDLSDDTIVGDLGAGNGILGIGALRVGAEKCIFLETDSLACKIIEKNLDVNNLVKSGFILNEHLDGDTIFPKVDLIVCNPPWGRQKDRADRPFLDLIIKNGTTSYLMHSTHATHIRTFFELRNWSVEKYNEFDFVLPGIYSHHSKERDSTKVGFYRLSPN